MNTINLSYPRPNFWDVNAPQISWINEKGFPRERHLQLRGIEEHVLARTFGTADRQEALRRQAIIRFLVENVDVRNWVLRTRFNGDQNGAQWMSGSYFCDYFNPNLRNQFWAKLGEFQTLLNEQTTAIPEELQLFRSFLAEARDQIEESEMQMASQVTTMLLKATSLSGSVVVRISDNGKIADRRTSVNIITSKAIGHRLYSLSNPKKFTVSPIWDESFLRKTFLGRWAKSIAKRRHQKKIDAWAKPITIDACPDQVAQAIVKYLNCHLFPKEGMIDCLQKYRDGDGRTGIDLYVRFNYGANGLRIQIVGLNQDTINPPDYYGAKWFLPETDSAYSQFRPQQVTYMREMDHEARRRSYVADLLTHFVPEFWKYIESVDKSLVSETGATVVDALVEDLFKWHQVHTLCTLDQWVDTYNAAQAIRRYANEHMTRLAEIAEIASAFVTRAEKWKLPLTFPEILDDKEPVFSFRALWPIGLIGRKTSASQKQTIGSKNLKPIRALGEIRGGISVMTGYNGAGKTTIGEEILGLLHDAASGFPVFGIDIRLNLRTVIGTIFLEKGDGSTMQLSLGKLAEVVRAVAQHSQNGTFVFWDEMGTGTTREEGIKLGMACLAKFHGHGCTIVTNTQIPELAELARSAFGAKCLQVDRDHVVRPGIGSADIATLARDMGVDEVLGLK